VIIVRLAGGLGNQMFQYAAGKQLAVKHNTILKLDLSWFENIDTDDTSRHYELGAYRVDENFYIKTLLSRAQMKTGYIKHYIEPHYQYDPSIESLGPKAYLEGYFQSWKYFSGIDSVITHDFSHKNEPNGENSKIQELILSDLYSVSLHIRRGDYATDKKTNSFHGVKDLGYYMAALKKVKKVSKKTNVYVFSNDQEWCRKHLRLGVPTVIIDENNDEFGGAEDMRLMRSCRHNIVANSSFSWWGAWLNQYPDKMIVAQKQWFNTSAVNTTDLVPPGWILL